MAIIADFEALKLEAFLRMRERGEIVWKTKDNKIIPIKDMTDTHLRNTMAMIEKHAASVSYFDNIMATYEDIH